MTATERLNSLTRHLWAYLGTMTPMDLLLNGALSVAVLLLAAIGMWLIRRALQWTAKRLPGVVSAERKVRTTRVVGFTEAVLKVFAITLAAVLVGRVWGVDVLGWASAGFGERIVAAILRLAFLAVAAVVALEVVDFLIGRGIQRMAAASVEARRQAQLNTLGPLLTGIARTAIVVVVALMALGELNVKIGPLLAGAGVVGIALGFGAQTLVKDFLTGLFLIIEDIVSVGDVVRIGDSGGQVEQMTLRTIRLRDFDGTLHVFPYGEAQVVHNLTKSFSFYVFNLQVSYGSDIDTALSVMSRVGAEMQAEPEFGDKILAPIEVVGVDSLGDSGVVLKARIKTLPIQQWVVGREYNRRIKLAFDQAGVEIPFPHMQVVLPDDQVSELVRH